MSKKVPKQDLLAKAKLIAPILRYSTFDWYPAAKAWIKGEVTASQLARAAGVHSTNVMYRIALELKDAYTKGNVVLK